MTKTYTTILVAIALSLTVACDSKAKDGAAAPEGATIVKEEIPADLAAEANKEITEDNADEMAAKLEAEIAADE